ncbi:DUF6326 family protein [Colwellia sp. RSH04]|jgi:hypothetical protein|uniref:DUF6326 family protein n=1 Tax=Colwellia sp. RSH04 TaxID=2305464 RepID=UPI001C70EE9B|nr:DUF6326 family protein [Colwellia sp. RSH04]
MKIFEWDDNRKTLLSMLWVFLTVNYIFCDVFTLHHAESLQSFLTGEAGGMKITEEFLLYFAFIMQIPMIMILLSRYLVYRPNKYLNIIAAIITGTIQSVTLYMGGTLHYIFFSMIEISVAVLIIYIAVTWKEKIVSSQ